MTGQELRNIKVESLDRRAQAEVKARWDSIAKPLDSLGEFESTTARIGAITGSADLKLHAKTVVIFCADNGIVEEGVSQTGQEITALVAESMARGESSVCKMAGKIGADIRVVDIGINKDMKNIPLIHRKVAYGTKNFRKEPAMSLEQTLSAIGAGIESALECKKEGCQIIAVGEMGIGNTTTSSAVAAALLSCPVEDIAGRGAGLSDEGLFRKREIIKEALDKYRLLEKEPLSILAAVGGLDIAGLAGLCIGGAIYRIPVVLDGVISAVAALAAERLVSGIKEFLIPSHLSREPAAAKIMQALSLRPVIDAGMALGEGTGAVMFLALLDMALAVYGNAAGFDAAGIEKYTRFEGKRVTP